MTEPIQIQSLLNTENQWSGCTPSGQQVNLIPKSQVQEGQVTLPTTATTGAGEPLFVLAVDLQWEASRLAHQKINLAVEAHQHTLYHDFPGVGRCEVWLAYHPWPEKWSLALVTILHDQTRAMLVRIVTEPVHTLADYMLGKRTLSLPVESEEPFDQEAFQKALVEAAEGTEGTHHRNLSEVYDLWFESYSDVGRWTEEEQNEWVRSALSDGFTETEAREYYEQQRQNHQGARHLEDQ